jgi:hypothetical protein
MLCHSYFGVNRSNKNGLHTLCKECRRKKDKLRDRRREVTGLPPQSEAVRNRKRKYRQELRKNVLLFLGGRCNSPECTSVNLDGTRGCVDERCLQIDHVNGDGGKDRKVQNHVSAFYLRVMKDTTGSYQLLCANCNWIKRYVNKEYPVGV